MHLKLDDFEIQNKYLTRVSYDHQNWIHFRGIALEEKGKQIQNRLSKFKKGEIIEFEVETSDFHRSEGYCEIVEIITHPPKEPNKASVIYEFSGQVKPLL